MAGCARISIEPSANDCDGWVRWQWPPADYVVRDCSCVPRSESPCKSWTVARSGTSPYIRRAPR